MCTKQALYHPGRFEGWSPTGLCAFARLCLNLAEMSRALPPHIVLLALEHAAMDGVRRPHHAQRAFCPDKHRD